MTPPVAGVSPVEAPDESGPPVLVAPPSAKVPPLLGWFGLLLLPEQAWQEMIDTIA